MEEKDTIPESDPVGGGQLTYPLDPDSVSIIERVVQDFKYPRSYWKNTGRMIVLKVIDDATALTTGDGKLIFNVPEELNGTLIQAVAAFVTTVSASGGPIDIQLRNVTDSVDILSTSLKIDDSEFDSYTATTAAVINFANAQLAKSDRIAVDVDDAGSGAKGLSVIISVQ